MLKRMGSSGSPSGSSSPTLGPRSGASGSANAISNTMARVTTPGSEGGDLSRAESARRVLEARRQKQKTDTPSTPVSSVPEASTPTAVNGVSQVLGGRLLQGIHDILMVMDEKVEHLVADVNTMRSDFRGFPVEGTIEQKLNEIQSRVDTGFATIFSQIKNVQTRTAMEESDGDEDRAHVPGSRTVDLISPTAFVPRRRTSSSQQSSENNASRLSRSTVHDLWEEMERMENMKTDDLIACENGQEDSWAVGPVGPRTNASVASTPPQPPIPPILEQRSMEKSPSPSPGGRRKSDRERISVEEAIDRISSRLSSARNSRASSNSPITQRSSARKSSKERVTFEERQGKTNSIKGLNHSRSMIPGRVDEMKNLIRPRQRSSMQKFAWNFLEDPDLVRGGRSYGNFLFMSIIISAVLPIVPTDATGREGDWLFSAIQYSLLILDCLFFVEVIARFYGAPHRLRFFGSIHNWVDILSVLVSVGMKIRLQSLNLAADAHLDVEGFELFLIVMVPVLRLLKLLRRFENSHLIKQAFRDAIGALPSLLYCMMVLVVGFSAIIYVLEPRVNVETMPRAIWFTMVTLTTVGYGDVVPISPGGNMVVCVLMIVSAMYMAMPLGIVGKAFGSVWDDRHRLLLMQRLRTRFSTVGYDPQDIPTLFCSYDENGDGELSMEEFRQMLQQLEVEAMDERAHDVFAAFDNDGSGAIDDSEFIKTLFPTAYKSMYKEREQDAPPKIEEEPDNIEEI